MSTRRVEAEQRLPYAEQRRVHRVAGGEGGCACHERAMEALQGLACCRGEASCFRIESGSPCSPARRAAEEARSRVDPAEEARASLHAQVRAQEEGFARGRGWVKCHVCRQWAEGSTYDGITHGTGCRYGEGAR